MKEIRKRDNITYRNYFFRIYSMRPFKLLILLLSILSACNLQQPHILKVSEHSILGNLHSDCQSCHSAPEPRKGSTLFAAGVDPSAICLDCHDYAENHHPVNFVPTDPSFMENLSFPVFNGEIRCLTCHEVHGGQGLAETPKLLRGGPYADRREVCFKCHYQERYAEIYPHFMKDRFGNIRKVNGEPICLICHAVKPDPEVDRTDDVRFKADVAFLCWRCHPPMPGDFFDKHFLVTPSSKILENIKNTEKERRVILPLVPRGRITCSTCHNPHQYGIIFHEPAKAGAGSRNKLRIPKSSICNACHYI